MLGQNRLSVLVRVGSEKPPSIAMEHGANLARTEAECWRDSVAQFSKVSPGFSEGGQGNVLCEDICGPDLGDDAGHLGPQVARVVGAESIAGDAPRLAWISARDDVDLSAPRRPVERPNIVVNRERLKCAIGLPRLQDSTTVRIDFDGTDARVTEHLAREDAAAHTSKEMQFTHTRRGYPS